HIALDGLGNQVGLLSLAPRVFVGPGVGIGPAVEAALLDVREVIGDQVVPEFVALLHGGVEDVGIWIPVDADGVARAGRIDLPSGAVGIVAADGGTMRIFA